MADTNTTPRNASDFSPIRNQANSTAVGGIAGVASFLAHQITAYAEAHNLDGLPTEGTLLVIISVVIGYILETWRDATRYYLIPLFRAWFKQRFGKDLPEPPQEAQ